jgi:heme-degrading monooxygenase HmoA
MNDIRFSSLPPTPYYAVIFASLRTAGDNGYDSMGDRMMELATSQAGFLGVESARDTQGFGITVSYWKDEASIRAWKNHAEHRIAQETGKERWYEHYITRIAKVERAYSLK